MNKFWFLSLLVLVLLIVKDEVSAQTDSGLVSGSRKPSVTVKITTQPAIQSFITYYQHGGRVMMESGLANSGLHKKMMRRIFKEGGIPENLVAISQTLWMGAADSDGLWLFDHKTAQKYGLRTTNFIDETLSFEKASRETARYLNHLSKKYKGNWELVLAAYYSGETEVDRAIKRGGSKSLWKISKYLPEAAQNFVPNVLATVLIADNPKRYGFADIQPDSPMVYTLVRVPPTLSLESIAKLSDSSLADIKSLNPELISTVTPPEPYVVRVPAGKGKIFAERVRSLPSK